MNMRLTLIVLVSLSALHGQNIAFVGSIGTGQQVPHPTGAGPSGLADLSGVWYNFVGEQRLGMQLHYIPASWAVLPGTVENCIFVFETGSAALPGLPRQGGLIYVPIPYNPGVVIARLGGVEWNGPGDTVPPTSFGNSGTPCPPGLQACDFGKSFGQTLALTPALIGTSFTCQAFMSDPSVPRLYSSNALNMLVVP